MRAFDWCQSERPWMTLNGHYALRCTIHAFSEPTAKTGMKIYPYYQQRRFPSSLLVQYGSVTLVSGNIRFMQRGASNDNFSTFARYFSEASVEGQHRLITQSLAAFTLTPKYVKFHFTLNSVLFCQVQFKICFFPYTESAITSILGINNISGEGHTIRNMYKPEACKHSKTQNINSYGLLKSI